MSRFPFLGEKYQKQKQNNLFSFTEADCCGEGQCQAHDGVTCSGNGVAAASQN